jgi:hypothetical protein
MLLLVRPGSLSPMLAAAASISNKSEPFDPLSHTNFSAETRLPGRTSMPLYIKYISGFLIP